MAFTFYETKYLDSTNLKAKTSVNEIKNLDTQFCDNLIIKAQLIIDNYIGEVEKYDESQDWKFPSTTSGDGVIPTNITMATLYLVENLFAHYKKEYGKDISQEAWDGYSISFKDGNQLSTIELIDGNIRNLLLEYGVNPDNQNKKAFKINY